MGAARRNMGGELGQYFFLDHLKITVGDAACVTGKDGQQMGQRAIGEQKISHQIEKPILAIALARCFHATQISQRNGGGGILGENNIVDGDGFYRAIFLQFGKQRLLGKAIDIFARGEKPHDAAMLARQRRQIAGSQQCQQATFKKMTDIRIAPNGE